MMHSPPVQPISLEHVGHRLGEHDVRGGDRQPRAQRRGRRARRRRPPARRRRPHAPAGGLRDHPAPVAVAARERERTRECSKIATPRSSSRRAQAEREPRRLHGRVVGHEHAAAEHAASRSARAPAPRSSARTASGLPSAAGGLDRSSARVVEGRAGRRAQVAGLVEPGVHAVVARTTRRSRATVSLDASSSERAASSPKRSRSAGALSQSDSQNPPFRPLGPWPQTSPSSRRTRMPGSESSRCQAVHIPV